MIDIMPDEIREEEEQWFQDTDSKTDDGLCGIVQNPDYKGD